MLAHHALVDGFWQEQVDATIDKTRKIVSGSEAIAWQLREEMEGRGGELSDRRRVAEEGLAVRWLHGARAVGGVESATFSQLSHSSGNMPA